MTKTSGPEAVVQAQLDAYNAHDVDALSAIYADDAQQFQHPATLLAQGSAQIRERFASRFAVAKPHAHLVKRIVAGNMVIDHEIVSSVSAEGPGSVELVAMYQVEDGRIAKAWFIFGAKTQLRLAQTSDIAGMEALIARSGIELSAGFYSEAQAAAVTRHVFGVDSQLVADQTYFLIERDGVLAACGGWSKRATLFGSDRAKTGPDPLLDPATQAARIRAFFVEPSMARQGLGRMLMEHCQRQAAVAGFTTMELAATMPGVPLYLASGFELAERFQIDLPDDIQVPLARMRKTI